MPSSLLTRGARLPHPPSPFAIFLSLVTVQEGEIGIIMAFSSSYYPRDTAKRLEYEGVDHLRLVLDVKYKPEGLLLDQLRDGSASFTFDAVDVDEAGVARRYELTLRRQFNADGTESYYYMGFDDDKLTKVTRQMYRRILRGIDFGDV